LDSNPWKLTRSYQDFPSKHWQEELCTVGWSGFCSIQMCGAISRHWERAVDKGVRLHSFCICMAMTSFLFAFFIKGILHCESLQKVELSDFLGLRMKHLQWDVHPLYVMIMGMPAGKFRLLRLHSNWIWRETSAGMNLPILESHCTEFVLHRIT
jgi:hypothetical protein